MTMANITCGAGGGDRGAKAEAAQRSQVLSNDLRLRMTGIGDFYTFRVPERCIHYR